MGHFTTYSSTHFSIQDTFSSIFCWYSTERDSVINSLALRRFEIHFIEVIFKLILVMDGWGISCEIVLTWTPQNLTDDKWTLVQVMAWCCQATSHYLSQCWPRSLWPYGVTRPQWVNACLMSFDILWCICGDYKHSIWSTLCWSISCALMFLFMTWWGIPNNFCWWNLGCVITSL